MARGRCERTKLEGLRGGGMGSVSRGGGGSGGCAGAEEGGEVGQAECGGRSTGEVSAIMEACVPGYVA